MEYQITFIHTVEQTYTALIEAESEEEARKMFDDEPFDHLVDEEPSDTQGLEIKITNIEQV
jgi:hypothetical protein